MSRQEERRGAAAAGFTARCLTAIAAGALLGQGPQNLGSPPNNTLDPANRAGRAGAPDHPPAGGGPGSLTTGRGAAAHGGGGGRDRAYTAVAAVAPHRLGAFIDQLRRERPGGDDGRANELRELALQRWVDLDPAAAFTHLAAEPPAWRDLAEVRQVAAAWAAVDFDAAYAAAFAWPEAEVTSAAAGAALVALGSADPLRALQLAAEAPRQAPGTAQVRRASWGCCGGGGPNYGAVGSFGDAAGGERWNDDAGAEIVRRWTARDPGAATARLAELPAIWRHGAARVMAKEWALTDPAEAFRWAGSLGRDDVRIPAMRDVMAAWIDHDFEAALPTIAASPAGWAKDEHIAAAAAKIAAVDPGRAFAWIDEHAYGYAYDRARTSALESLAEADPAAGIEWIRSSELAGSEEWVQDVLSHWYYTDPAAARTWARGQGDRATDTPGGDHQLEELLAQIRGDRGAGAAPVRTEDDAMAREAAETASRQMAYYDLEGALEMAARAGGESLRPELIHRATRSNINAVNPFFAAEVLGEIGDDDDRARAHGRVAGLLARGHLGAALEWVNGLPAGRDHDAAAARVARELRSIDPARGLAWAAAIGDPEQREVELRQAWSQLQIYDPHGAGKALDDLGLTDGERQSLLAGK